MIKIKQWWKEKRRKFWTWWYELNFRGHSCDVCCCGEPMENHSSPMMTGHSPVCEVDWAVRCLVANRMGEKP